MEKRFTECNKVLAGRNDRGLIVLGFNDTSTLVGYFMSSPRERKKRDRRDSRRDERGTGKKQEQANEETDEIKLSTLYPYLLQR